MTDQNDIKKIKDIIEDFFQRMTIVARINFKTDNSILEGEFLKEGSRESKNSEIIDVDIKVDDPQILIGEKGQTLNEIQRILKMIISRMMENPPRINVDINEYKKKKTEYLRSLAKDIADEVALTKETKTLLPMSSYERMVIHTALSNREDVITESEGEGPDRKVVIKPK